MWLHRLYTTGTAVSTRGARRRLVALAQGVGEDRPRFHQRGAGKGASSPTTARSATTG